MNCVSLAGKSMSNYVANSLPNCEQNCIKNSLTLLAMKSCEIVLVAKSSPGCQKIRLIPM